MRALQAALALLADGLAAMGRAGSAHVAARFAPHKDYVLDQMVAVRRREQLVVNGASTGAAHS